MAGEHPCDGQMSMDFPASFRILSDDALYICGNTDALAHYREGFPTSRL